jgi:hypothetical protein
MFFVFDLGVAEKLVRFRVKKNGPLRCFKWVEPLATRV